ncbi:phosphotransferase [Bacillus sp. T33-2]|uniref:phosphotransferase n=1 Tax=Bacillus sp. T33-2 TaxID=2054168 RepID=UPI000C757C2A|nr:phosphotransferase [Bacillus sp. T33-2]PLR96869.1 aminoglycoside phosphotransferase family protein [Bacillus sp. T33-2]
MKNEKLNSILQALPHLQINDIKQNQQGWDNDIVIINDELVFRFPKNEEIAKKLITEKLLLDILSEKTPVIALPVYKLINADQEKLICTYHEYIPGNPLTADHFGKFDTDEAAKLLADFLSKLHSIDSSDAQMAGLSTIHTKTYWSEFHLSIKDEIYPFLSASHQLDMDRIFEDYFASISAQTIDNRPIHGDLTGANIIYNTNENKLSGVIDFTDAQIGDPAFDFAGFYWDFGPAFTQKVLSYYGGSEPSSSLFGRVQSFYGLQPVFHEWLYCIRNGLKVDLDSGMLKLKRLQEHG